MFYNMLLFSIVIIIRIFIFIIVIVIIVIITTSTTINTLTTIIIIAMIIITMIYIYISIYVYIMENLLRYGWFGGTPKSLRPRGPQIGQPRYLILTHIHLISFDSIWLIQWNN